MDSNSQDQNKTAFEESNAGFGSVKPARGMHPALRVLTYVLAFLLGAGAAVGAIVGTVVYGYNNVPVGSVLEKVYPNYRELLSEDFASKSVGGIIGELSSGNIQTLGDVQAITPCVDGILNELDKMLSECGIEADRTQILSVRFENLGTYFSEDLLKTARLDRMLSVDADSDPFDRYLAYGAEGSDYTVTDGEIVMAEGKSVHTLDTLLDPEKRTQLIDGMRLCDVMTITEDSADALKTLKDTKIDELPDRVKQLTIEEAVRVDESASHLVKSLRKTKISDLRAKLEVITLGEVTEVNEDSPRILQKLADCKIEEIDKEVNALTMEDILGEEAFGHNVVLDALRLSRLDTVADDIEVLTVNELFRDDIYDADGNVKGVWRYFLLEDGVEQQTYLKDINHISNRVAVNVNRAKLYDLEADRMITLQNPSDLNRQITVDGNRVNLGDLTVSELVDHLLLFVR